MANNRLYLACTQCLEDPATTWDACAFCLAKYYPSTGWYDPFPSALNTWFDQHQHGDMFGEFITLVYEHAFDERAQAKRAIMITVASAIQDTLSEKGDG